jgi:ribosomal-protein-alanine N-acetyltransferase
MLEITLQPFPLLETERTVLRRIDRTDAEDLFALRTHPSVMQFIGKDPPKSIDDTFKMVEAFDRALDQNDGITWGVCLRESSRIIGTMGFWRITKEHHRAEIGYMLMPEYMGNGLMSEVLVKTLDFAFNQLRLHSIEANIDPLNEASRKILLRHGFAKEAYFKENFFYNGKFLDSEIYSLVRSER